MQLVNSIGGNVSSTSEFKSVLGLDPTGRAAVAGREPPASENDQSRDEFSPDSTKELEMRAIPPSTAPMDLAGMSSDPHAPSRTFLLPHQPLSDPPSASGEMPDFAQLLSRHTGGASDVPSSRASGTIYNTEPP